MIMCDRYMDSSSVHIMTKPLPSAFTQTANRFAGMITNNLYIVKSKLAAQSAAECLGHRFFDGESPCYKLNTSISVHSRSYLLFGFRQNTISEARSGAAFEQSSHSFQ